jgi:hypothetical protein
MDDALSILTAALPVVLYAVAIFVLTWITRRAAEHFRPVLRLTPWWTELALPTLPALYGLLGALPKGYPFPDVLMAPYPRAFLGLSLGFFSAWAYMIVKKAVGGKFGVELPDPQ